MSVALAISWAASLLAGCSVIPSRFDLPADMSRDSASRRWTQPTALVGKVPLSEALSALVTAELLDHWPVGQNPTVLTLRQGSRLCDLRDEIERNCMWVFVGREFVRWNGNGANDVNLMLGRPRTFVHFSVRFRAANANASFSEAGVGASIWAFGTEVPDGGVGDWNRTSQRSIVLTTPVNVGNTTVAQTQREVASAGVTFHGTMCYLPGGFGRVEGDLNVSSFLGRDLNQSIITAPLRLDVPRGKWVTAHTFVGSDAALAFSLKGTALAANVSADAVCIEVRID